MIKKITELLSVLLLSAAILCVSASFLFKNRAEYVQAQIDYNQFKSVEKTKELITKEIDCLAKNIYYEAKGEKFEGKLAVAQVTLNRTKSNDYPSSICDVVYQKELKKGKWECQFSWVCNNVKHPSEKYVWEESLYIARKALTMDFDDDSIHDKLAETNATFFHSNKINPKKKSKYNVWNKVERVAVIGKHIFYNLKG